jgi:hypothetical protein
VLDPVGGLTYTFSHWRRRAPLLYTNFGWFSHPSGIERTSTEAALICTRMIILRSPLSSRRTFARISSRHSLGSPNMNFPPLRFQDLSMTHATPASTIL